MAIADDQTKQLMDLLLAIVRNPRKSEAISILEAAKDDIELLLKRLKQ